MREAIEGWSSEREEHGRSNPSLCATTGTCRSVVTATKLKIRSSVRREGTLFRS